MAFDFDIENISLDGFQVVKSTYFGRQTDPAMTIWRSAIAFNTASHEALNNCETIELRVNEKAKSILIKPISSKDSEPIPWKKGKEKSKTNRLECSKFAKHLFDTWNLAPEFHYRTTGKLVQCDRKIMLLFDFSKHEVWSGSKLVKENG